jgi:hypothetical protein
MFKNFIYTFVFLSLVACNKNTDDCTVSLSCDTEPVLYGTVYIDVTYSQDGPDIPVVLYRGFVEDKDTLWYGYANSSKLSFNLPNNTRYAAEVFYPVASGTLVALDGNKLKQESNNECGVTCYKNSSITLKCKKK